MRITPATFVRVLLVKAVDADGKRLFADAEEQELLEEADPAEVMRLANLIIDDLNRTAEAAREPGEPNPNA